MIVAEDLTKNFGRHRAVDSVSFQIDRGVIGFLGPNGAGKSTTMRLLTGFIEPDAGRAAICGHDCVLERRQAQACLGYLPEACGGFGQLTVLEALSFCGEARGLRGDDLKTALLQVVRQLDLGTAIGAQIRTLSKGWRQRVWLAQAIVHAPSVLILDEPTDGLDPLQRDQVRRLIRSLADHVAILLSTHNLEEVEEVCDRVICIREGKIVADDTVRAMSDSNGRLGGAFRRLMTQPDRPEMPDRVRP